MKAEPMHELTNSDGLPSSSSGGPGSQFPQVPSAPRRKGSAHASGSNYVVQASSNLSSAIWLPLLTNASPFTFVDTSSTLGRRYYRAVFIQ
jgi:hypothetical protein